VNPTRRLALLGLSVAALAAAAAWLPLPSFTDAVDGLGGWAPVVAVLSGGMLLAALVPRTPISLACGLLFGPAAGSVLALAVALTGATLTFIAGRLLGREFVARRTGRWWVQLRTFVERESVLAVAAVRALPLGPYGLAGYVYGSSPVRARDYFLGTIIAATPSAVSYAIVGAVIAAPGDVPPLALLPLAMGLVFSAVVLVRARRAYRPGVQPIAAS
jgi:uncharacterized membrane protein YdjX (TVP38/TMEM64 family)